MSCSDPNISPELKIACDCQESVKKFTDSFATYKAQVAAHDTKEAVYNAAWRKYKSDYQIWESRKATKRKELVDEVKIWNRCVLWTGVYGHDDWCQSDTGFGRQTGAGGYGCIDSQGKGTCQRTTTQVDEELNKWVGSNPPPIPPSGGSNGNVTPCSTCNPPLGNIIQCCANYMSGDSSTFKDNIQTCNQSIEQKIQEITGSPSNPVVPSNSVVPVSTSPVDCETSVWGPCVEDTQVRTVTTPAKNGGKACGPLEQSCTSKKTSANNSWLLAIAASVIVICIFFSIFLLL